MLEPVTITDNAKEAIARRLQKAPTGTQGLRLTVKDTGCSGHSYAMEYVGESDDSARDDRFGDLYIPKTVSWMMFGMEIDYGMDELGNETFLFNNPNEVGRCGCGESFRVAEQVS